MNEFKDLMGLTVETGYDRLDQKLNNHLCYGGGSSDSVTTQTIDPDIKKALLPGIHQASADFQAGKYGAVAGQEGMTGALDTAQDTTDQLRNVFGSQINVGADIGTLSGAYGEGRDETRQLGQQALSGTGVFDNTAAVNRQLQNLQGNLVGQAAGSGALTSARGNRAREAALADQAMVFNQARQQNALQGASMLSGLGEQATQAQLTGAGLQSQAAQGLGQATQSNISAEDVRRNLQQQQLDAPYQAASKYFSLLNQAPSDSTTTTSGGGK